VFGHDYVADQAELVSGPDFIEDAHEAVAGFGFG
jgi:hypothetical protein